MWCAGKFRLILGKAICLAVVDLWELGMDLQMDQDLANSSRLFLHDCSQSWG